MEKISLKRLEVLHNRLEAMKDERTAYEELLTAVPAIDYGKAKVQTSLIQEPAFARVAEKVSCLDAQIESLSIEFVLLKSQIIERLYQLPKKQRTVLFKRYVEFKSLAQVAGEMELSYSYVRYLNKRGLEWFYTNNK